MKNIFFKLFSIWILLITPFSIVFSQNSINQNVDYEVNRILPYLSITSQELNNAKSLKDLDRLFKPSWVSKYISVEVRVKQNGMVKSIIGENNILTKEQKDLMKQADIGSDIFVNVVYLPNNSLKHNEPKNHDFNFSVDPDNQAEFVGGQEKLIQFIRENAIDHLPDDSFKDFDLTAVKFTVNEEGEVTNAYVFDDAYQPYNNKDVNNLLLNCIKKMPCWKPAQYSDGTKVKQEFALTVGNMKSCVVNLINIRRLQ